MISALQIISGEYTGEKRGIFDIYYSNYEDLRYGENPHQRSRLYNIGDNGFEQIFEKLHGKELSYINILDIDAAYNLINEFDEPACAIFKTYKSLRCCNWK